MKFFKPYKSLLGYLERFTVAQIGRLHIRVHRIKSADKTPFYHSHPFHYVSVVISGGYCEALEGRQVEHGRGAIILRNANTFHRINSVQENTTTLFIAWKVSNGFKLKKVSDYPGTLKTDSSYMWPLNPPGLYLRELYGRNRYCKFNGFWFKAHDSLEAAFNEVSPSIDQTTQGRLIKSI